jgi:trimeric autotransporter adhesin
MRAIVPILLVCLICAQLSSNCLAQSGIITTYAGKGLPTPGLPVSGALATTQSLGEPASVVPEGVGGFYVSDSSQNQIYYVAANGRLRLVAGSGVQGYGGDDGKAIFAQLARPRGVAVDASSNLYIADTDNNRIRKVTPGGIITTVAGNGTHGSSGDGGRATSAQLAQPYSVVMDSTGNLYIADMDNSCIRKVTPAGMVSTVAGNGTSGYSGDGEQAIWAQLARPRGVAVDSAGNLFIADTDNSRIRKISPAGIITTVAGKEHEEFEGFSLMRDMGDGGKATSALLTRPCGVAVDSMGNLFIADNYNNRIRKVSPAGIITTVAGTANINLYPKFWAEYGGVGVDGGQATSTQLFGPEGIAVDSTGNLLIAETGNQRIRNVTSVGIITTLAGKKTITFSGDGRKATSALLNSPHGIAVDSKGNLFIADTGNHRIRKVTPAGVINTIVGDGVSGYSGDGLAAIAAQLARPCGLAVDSKGNLYIADTGNSRIRKVTPAGVITTIAGNGTSGYSGDGGQATSAQLAEPIGIALDSAGNLFIADSGNHRIRKVATHGVITTVAGNGTGGYSGDDGQATSAQLNRPEGIAVDSAGNLFIVDRHFITESKPFFTAVSAGFASGSRITFIYNDHIRKVAPDGVITTVAGKGTRGFSGDGSQSALVQADELTSVAVDSAGNLYFSDHNRIFKITLNGAVAIVTGKGTNGFSGDGGQAASAQLNGIGSIVVDSSGNLFIADTDNHRIRKVMSSSR